MMSKTNITGVALAAFIAISPTEAAAQDKSSITIGEYCERQGSGENQASLHLGNSPYRSSFVNVPTYSSVHGNLTLTNFNCESLIPICSTGGFGATKGTLSSIHTSLGDLNASDDPVVIASLRALGNNIDTINSQFVRSSQSVQHLQGPKPGHGLDLFTSSGRFDIGATTRDIYEACAAELRR